MVFWAAVGAAVIAVSVILARHRLRRLAPSDAVVVSGRAAPSETPQALEREAVNAESRGNFGEAIRLRFRAGLLTLGARSLIDYRPSLRTAEVSRKLRSSDFDSLAGTFERVAYGGGEAGEADVAAAREGWKRVMSAR